MLRPYAMIVSFTDVLTDLKNQDEEFFSDTILEKFLDKNYKLDPEAFNTKLLGEINRFRGNMDITDDIAVLTCKIY